MNIYDRTRVGHPICKGCGDHEETVEHLLFHCPRAQQVWKCAPIQWDGVADQVGCFKNWWWSVFEATSRKDGSDHLALTANILWQLWKSRNEWEFHDNQKHPMQVVNQAHSEWLEFLQVNSSSQHQSRLETKTETVFSSEAHVAFEGKNL